MFTSNTHELMICVLSYYIFTVHTEMNVTYIIFIPLFFFRAFFFSQVSKTLKATYAALLESICDDDCNPVSDVSASLSQESTGDGPNTKLSLTKRRANQQETEIFYFNVSTKFVRYI